MSARDEQVREEGFKAAYLFARQAAEATSAVPTEVLEDAIEYGEKLVGQIGGGMDRAMALDDALQLEHALRTLRPLLIYRRALENPDAVTRMLNAIHQNGGGPAADEEEEES